MPAQHRSPSGVVPAAYTPPPVAQGAMPRPQAGEEGDGLYLHMELPGPQRLFMRDSESQFFDRLAQNMKKADGTRAIFPDEPVVSKQAYRPRNFPRMVELVEPSYVCHGRLLWEQPNFERTGYDLGVLQPAICMGVFFYDTALFPYHCWSDLSGRGDCSVGKCMPGDQAPFVVPCERFSVTGIVGQTGAMIGLGFLLQ